LFIIMTTFLLAVKKIALHELKQFCDQNREKPAELMHFLEKKSVKTAMYLDLGSVLLLEF